MKKTSEKMEKVGAVTKLHKITQKAPYFCRFSHAIKRGDDPTKNRNQTPTGVVIGVVEIRLFGMVKKRAL
ncbi:hypothetical protein [Moraxella sp. ZY200743]|uniref:hypothetical protein n=1 Tax=Moraxella sp. ZY200743 TaxID=2911970 RepID=UPI003D7DDA8D